MIITRTPFRISFFGGGTDYPAWYKEKGGAVLSTTINKYCYINCRYLPPFFNNKHLIRYSMREEVNDIGSIRHPSVRECLRFLKIKKGVEIVHTGDLPARSGIGSSSSFTVGLLSSLYALQGKMTTKRQLALAAIHVEQKCIKECVGSQDQIAVAFGGINKIEFGGEEEFRVNPVTISSEKIEFLQDNLIMFFTGFSRYASEVAIEQVKNIMTKHKDLKEMMGMVDDAIEILNGRAAGFKDFGRLLHESWRLKRGLSGLISNSDIDAMYDAALKSGALGGKLLGAGGGGFILFYAPPEKHERIKKKLGKLLHVPFRFEKLGAQVILYSTQDFI